MKISIQSFKGVSPRTNPRYLDNGAAQVALNVEAFGQSLRPLKGLSPPVVTLDPPEAITTLYRFGQDYAGEDAYWCRWGTEVDVCRFQIAGDTKEWTCYTGDGYPKLTNVDLALTGDTAYPVAAVRLGLPAPSADNVALVAAVTDPPQRTDAAEVALTATHLTQMTSAYGVKVSTSTDDGETWTTHTAALIGTLPSVTLSAAQVAEVNTEFDVYVSLDNGQTQRHCPLTVQTNPSAATVTVTSTGWVALDYGVSLWITIDGVEEMQAGTWNPGSATLADVVTSIAGALVTANGWTISTKATGPGVRLDVVISDHTTRVVYYGFDVGDGGSLTDTAAAIVSAINTYAGNLVTATAGTGGTVTVTADYTSSDVRLAVWWGLEDSKHLYATGTGFTPAQVAAAITALDNVTAAVDGSGVTVTSVDKGSDIALKVQWGDQTGRTLTAGGATQDLGLKETRVYTFTYLYQDDPDEPTLTIESAPWSREDMASTTVEVYTGTGDDRCWRNTGYSNGYTEATCANAGGTWEAARSLVTLSGFALPPTEEGWSVTGVRVYRAVAGVYLFVDEVSWADLTAKGYTYVDHKLAAELGEPCPSVTWSAPPEDLQGLVNLPNGLAAGFVGREVYFCPAYRPYTYPQEYVQTLDYPIVGLACLDTTLVVLTEGTPYLIQGTAPEYMRGVKYDLEQACVSKRSIVSLEGAVLYASPDGLVLLTAGGGSVISEALFRREDWQKLHPQTIHAYGHDGKYIAFHAKATVNGFTYYGFILDLKSKQFVQHNLSTVTAGYNDLRHDQLYLATTDYQVVKWEGGYPLLGHWRSKRFTLPQVTGFSCAQVEPENFDGPYLSTDKGEYKPIAYASYNTKARGGLLVTADPFIYTPLNAAGYTTAGGGGVSFHLRRGTPGARTEHVTALASGLVTSRDPFRLEARQGRDWEVDLLLGYEVFNVVIGQSVAELAEA